MNPLSLVQSRFRRVLSEYTPDPTPWVDLVRRSQDARFGDYQANFAMPMAKVVGRPARDLAAEIASRVELEGLCDPPEVAGPGFINLRLLSPWIEQALQSMASDSRLGIPLAAPRRRYVIDYSAPNVAKPMHVGHIRSTVIGDCLYRVLRFLGHEVIGDNHLGDWGTQFGMIIYGYRHFLDEAAFRRDRVSELARLYKLVNRLVDYQEARSELSARAARLARDEEALARARADEPKGKKPSPQVKKLEVAVGESRDALATAQSRIESVEADPALGPLAAKHADVHDVVLAETARLHAGDQENRRLWREFMPSCLEAIDRVYRRLGVTFDQTLGESFYHDRLAGVVEDLLNKGIASNTQGAVGVFLEGHETPFLVQKQDGAFLYATSDLATIRYRMETWSPSAILYVVDHRQSLHFEQLFATAKRWGYRDVELSHLAFGTVMGEDGRPYKTRSGDTVGLEGLLDEAVSRALAIVSANDDAKPDGPELSKDERDRIARTVGIAAIKYADLSHNRTSDYVFSYDKMLSMTGNTATYLQYAYARVRSIFSKGGIDLESLVREGPAIRLAMPEERALGVQLVRFEEVLNLALSDYRPNQLTGYLYDLANCFSTFFEGCPVLKAPGEDVRSSRLALAGLTARVLKQGLALLGIDVVDRM
jgi:arginyl-tRNA synthetase